MKNLPLKERMKNASAGILQAWRGERSFRTQIMMALAALVFFAWWGLSPQWWAIVAITIALVLAAELINTSIETLADHLHPEHHPAIGAVKDLAAGMVLVIAFAAVIVGVLAILSNPR